MADERLIINPKSGDRECAHDILSEICGVLKKHKCVMLHSEHGMVLAKIADVYGRTARAIAQVKTLTPDTMEWREVDWTPKEITKQ